MNAPTNNNNNTIGNTVQRAGEHPKTPSAPSSTSDATKLLLLPCDKASESQNCKYNCKYNCGFQSAEFAQVCNHELRGVCTLVRCSSAIRTHTHTHTRTQAHTPNMTASTSAASKAPTWLNPRRWLQRRRILVILPKCNPLLHNLPNYTTKPTAQYYPTCLTKTTDNSDTTSLNSNPIVLPNYKDTT
jgi:hypothetical protein